jgi:hypothetical protein
MNSAFRSDRTFFYKGLGGILNLSLSEIVAVPLKSRFQEIGSILPLLRSIDVVIRKEKISLSRSKRPREMLLKIMRVITFLKFSRRSSCVSP